MDTIIVRTPEDPTGTHTHNRFNNASAYVHGATEALVVVHGSNVSMPDACVPLATYAKGHWTSYCMETDRPEDEQGPECDGRDEADQPLTFGFGSALGALKHGHRVARTGWNGKGMWLSLSCDGTREVPVSGFWSKHNAAHAYANGGKATVLPSITMKTADGSILMGWLASQTDMLAEDWHIVPDTE